MLVPNVELAPVSSVTLLDHEPYEALPPGDPFELPDAPPAPPPPAPPSLYDADPFQVV